MSAAEADAFVHAVARDWRSAPLGEQDRELCEFAERLTGDSEAVDEGGIDALRRCGLDDRAIHDATQVVAFFNYINRVASALGVEQETFVRAWEQAAEESGPQGEGKL